MVQDASTSRPDMARQLLESEVAFQLVRAYGVTKFDLWLGKDGLEQRSMNDVAQVVVKALWPVVGEPEALERVLALHAEGLIAAPAVHDPNDW